MTNSLPRKTSPPYWIGFFCIVPLIGAILGIVMIVKGIRVYRERLFAIIGAVGIVWTIALYSLFFYASRHFEAFTKGWESLSQTQLNELMKNIEIYKLQHGIYPDNLQDLLKDDKSIIIFDAIQTGRGTKDIYYHYEKKDNGYVLFSVGLDGIANTEDDLYPQVENGNALGLISKPKTIVPPPIDHDGYYFPTHQITNKDYQLEWISVFISPTENMPPTVKLRFSTLQSGNWREVACKDYTITNDSLVINYNDKTYGLFSINGSFSNSTQDNLNKLHGVVQFQNNRFDSDFNWTEGD